MATLFSKVYDKFLRMIKDLQLANLTDEDLKYTLYDYLENSSVEFKRCKKDLQDIVVPSNYAVLYNGDGIKKEFDIDLIPYDLEYEVVVDSKLYEKDKDFSIDTVNKKVQLKSAPSKGINNIDIKWSFDGQFNQDLSNEEILILSQGCVLYWIQNQLLVERKMKETIGDRDYKRSSTANLLDKLIKVDELYTKKLRNSIRSYEYLCDEAKVD